MRESQQKALQYHYYKQQTSQQLKAEYERWQSGQQMIRQGELGRDAHLIEAPTLTTEQVTLVTNVVQEQFHAHGVNLVSVPISIAVIYTAVTLGAQGFFEAFTNVIELHNLNRK